VTYQLANAKVWDGAAWVEAVGGAGGTDLRNSMIQGSTTVSVVSSSTANTLGAWTEVIASTAAEADLLVLSWYNVGVNATNSGTIVQVGLGAAGAETAVVTGITIGSHYTNLNVPAFSLDLPVHVPNGSRISLRQQSAVAPRGTSFQVALYPRAVRSPNALQTFGANAATSSGTAPATSWTEIVAATTEAYRSVVMLPAMATATVGALGDATIAAGIGASGSEAVQTTVEFGQNTNEYCQVNPARGCVFGPVPSGARLSATRTRTNGSFNGTVVMICEPYA
jgi:hypothetical protein